jgi:tellurite resistance protein TerC
MRLGFILLGVWLVTQFHWLLYIMGVFLVLTGLKICVAPAREKELSESLIMKVVKRFFRMTHELHGNHFFIRKNALLYATPLFVTLIFVEISDIIFAIDSIPAIFAITMDPFIVWTSNIFAILGLRAMYFLLSGMVKRFSMLKYGIALILIFVGAKMVMEPWLPLTPGFSLGAIAIILLFFTVLSMMRRTR